MNYQETLQFIRERAKSGTKLGLERISAILELLDNPQQSFPAVHIAGTNGKGSTVAFFDNVLRAAGYKTGRYTSPHLASYRERFSISGEMIAPERLTAMVDRLRPVLDRVEAAGHGAPTEFEIGTALAFLYFAEEQVDIAIIEVGMGGRFDATNVLKPVLSVITHIAFDHQEYLGETLDKIAFEKAGIIKPGVPLVIGRQEDSVEKLLREMALSRQSLYSLVNDIEVSGIRVSEDGTTFHYRLKHGRVEKEIQLGLIGAHQVENALNVLAGFDMLRLSGFQITTEQLQQGLAKTAWPARFERIHSTAPLKLFLDGAHNPDGFRVLVDTISRIYPGIKVDLLIGILANRPLAEMAAIIAPLTRRVITTRVPDPKSSDPNELAAHFQRLGIPAQVEPDPGKALEKFLKTDNTVAVACGSFYLTGWLRARLLPMEE